MPLISYENKPLPEEMQAVVLKKPYTLEYAKIPTWPIEKYHDPDIILIEVKACGVCGSDFRYYQGENPWAQHTMGKHVENPPNIVLGHEYSGIVVGVLSEENTNWLGKRVVPICSRVCGICEMCKTNRAHLCENTIHMGHGQGWGSQAYYPGAYATYAPAWAKGCYEIPEKVSFEDASMMDVLAVCMHAFDRANHRKDLSLLIMGAGPIGNGIGQIARNSGVEPHNIIVLENSTTAIEVAERTGFQTIINSSKKQISELYENIVNKSGSSKVYSIFDSIGTNDSFKLAFKLLDKGGSFVNLAVHDLNIQDFNQMQLSSERSITTSSNFSLSSYKRAWEWLCQGKFTLDPWLTRITLNEVPQIFADTIKNKRAREYFKLIIQQK